MSSGHAFSPRIEPTEISARIDGYFGKISGAPNHRYRSWEHCYRYFHAQSPSETLAQLDLAALHLGFYLASWGMYRGSTFLLQRDYTVHKPTVNAVLSERFAPLWERDIGAGEGDKKCVPLIIEAANAVRQSYRPVGAATDTLVTKVLLGTMGCVPACDSLFVAGWKRSEQPYSYFNAAFLGRIVAFCATYIDTLRDEQEKIASAAGIHYPVMKLADMYFWQIGFESAGEPADIEA
jgi:hypothetical protein